MIGELEKLGFDIRDFGNSSVIIHGIPSDMIPGDTRKMLEMMIEQYKNMEGELRLTDSERMARITARTSAIGYGIQLTDIEMQNLVDQLFACKNPDYTPSGKPIVKITELEELDNTFNL
jgi:DNA mismatch repair protein MutL